MRLSFNTWALGSFPAWLPSYPLELVIDRLGELGYDGIELGAAAPQGFPAYLPGERRRRILDHARARGISFTAICPAVGGGPGYNPVSVLPAEREAAHAYLRDCVDLASDLECPSLIFLAGYRAHGQSHAAAWAWAVDALHQAGEAAAERGVRMLVEPTPADSNVCEDLGDARKLVDEAQVDAGLMFDSYHALHRCEDFEDMVVSAGDSLEYVHLADRHRDPPGTHTDFTMLIHALREAGYDGWLTMEIGFNRREVDPFGLARAALAHIGPLVEAG